MKLGETLVVSAVWGNVLCWKNSPQVCKHKSGLRHHFLWMWSLKNFLTSLFMSTIIIFSMPKFYLVILKVSRTLPLLQSYLMSHRRQAFKMGNTFYYSLICVTEFKSKSLRLPVFSNWFVAYGLARNRYDLSTSHLSCFIEEHRKWNIFWKEKHILEGNIYKGLEGNIYFCKEENEKDKWLKIYIVYLKVIYLKENIWKTLDSDVFMLFSTQWRPYGV